MGKSTKYYVVRQGRQPGIYMTWEECQKQVNGFSGAIYKSFSTLIEAEGWFSGKSPIINLPSQQKSFIPSPEKGKDSSYTIYTDGSCQNGKGGWAYVVVKDGVIVDEKSGALPDFPTTNNRAELTAILKVLECHYGDLTIISDSEYSIKCVSVWCHVWQKRGWKKADGETPENLDLILAIIANQTGRKVSYQHVYAHRGNVFNERCDTLAGIAASI